METMVQCFNLFQTFDDSSTEYKLKKIGYDDDEFVKLCNALPSTVVKLTCVGFVGDFEQVVYACAEFLKCSVEEIQQLPVNMKSIDAISSSIALTTRSEHSVETERLFLIQKGSQIAFIYRSVDPIFSAGPLPPTALAVDYARYMLDVCENIIVIPPSDIICDDTIANPFQDTINIAIHIQERRVQPNETISISLLKNTDATVTSPVLDSACNVTSNICHPSMRMSHDHSRFLYTFSLHDKTETTKRTMMVSLGELNNSIIQPKKLIDYVQAINTLRDKWHKPEFFNNLKERSLKVFKNIISPEKLPKFDELLDMIEAQYQSTISNSTNKNDLQFLEEIVQRFERKSCAKRTDAGGEKKTNQSVIAPKDQGPLSNETIAYDCTTRTDKCNDACRTVENILKSLEDYSNSEKYIELQNMLKKHFPNSLRIMIHCDRWSKLSLDTKSLWDKHMKKQKSASADEFDCARQSFIVQLIEWLNDNSERVTQTLRFCSNFLFYEINPIIDVDGNISDFKLSRKGFELREQHMGSIEHVYLSQIIFTSDKIGYFNLANHPLGRSSIFCFNFSHASTTNVQLVQQCSSSVSKLIIDEKSNIYLIYDNINQRAERGKLDKHTGRLQSSVPIANLFGNVIEDLFAEDGAPKLLTQIETACFLYGSSSILILDEQFNLIEYQYMKGSLKYVCCRINKDTHIEKVELRPSGDSGSRYTHVNVIPSGKCVLLQCSTSIDIYDLTWTKIGCIPIAEPTNFIGFKSFADQINTYVALIDRYNTATVYLLRGLSATRTLDVKRIMNEEMKGFPPLDILYLAQRKFGPPSGSIGSPRKTHITFVLPSNFPISSDKLDTYFMQLHTIGMTLEIESCVDKSEWSIIFQRLPQIPLNAFKRIIETRVPIHVATIEESNIFPLQDGRNITNDIALWKHSSVNKTSLVQYITELTRIGSYEQLLARCNQPLKVIAIVGHQNGGKSYFLNRVAGTRFNVASTRCTDGIWLSIAFIHEQPVVVLDCEGLFSTRRSDLEEMKLCLTLTAVADALLLNQDYSFNRYLNQLFSNFAKSCERIKGSQLFKGFLMMVIRDVSTQDAEGAYIELINNVRHQATNNRSGYLEKLFGGKVVGQCLHHFENGIFDAEVEAIRKMIFDLPFRWNTGFEFLENLKVTLAQVHTDDDTSVDVHRLRMSFARLEREAHVMMMQGGKQFCTCEKVAVRIRQMADCNDNDEILVDQELLNFVDSDDGFTALGSSRNSELPKLTTKFMELIEGHFECEYQEQYHNAWFNNINHLQMTVLEHRINFVMSYVHNQLTNDPTYAADVGDFEIALRTKLGQFIQGVRLCLRACHECRRVCTAKFDHRDDCNCETDHVCRELCGICCNSNICCQLYGHGGIHRCDDGHVCGKPCTITPICTFFCSLEINHNNQDKHDCTNRHYCPQKCSQNPQCDKVCVLEVQVEHVEHICGETVCPFACQMPDCRQRCVFPNHQHQRLIDEKNTQALEQGEITVDYHVCGANHTCVQECVEPGVCSVEYDVIEKNWENPMNTFPYKFYEPKSARSKCVIPIPLHTLTHANQTHNCKIDHRCGSQCPECRSFCQLSHGHATPYHHTNAHRNKECNVFVSKHHEGQSVLIKNEGRSREYKPGESCKPEVCSESCERRGRAHFHLKPCPGEEKCASKLYPYVKHSVESWYPFQDRIYDLWLCEAYWHSLGWNVPFNDDVLAMINSCSFFCSHPSHTNNSSSFCTKVAWHTDDHMFSCKHDRFDKLDIVFCCDATGSMSSYIKESKKTVRRIIEASKAIKDVKFRFVAYRDHPPDDTSFVTQSNPENLSNETAVVAYIDQLIAKGGGYGPEAVLDGLNDAVTCTRWRDATTLKYIIHIADAPPHGYMYTNGKGRNWFMSRIHKVDRWPDGCPCGLTIEQISEAINDKNIRYKLMKIGTFPNTMASIFKNYITDFEETDLNGPLDLSDKFVDILARDLQTEEIDVIA